MSAFVVISTQERLNWIVDKISENKPANHAVGTLIWGGYVMHTEKGVYFKHTSAEKQETKESITLYEALENHLAAFKKVRKNFDMNNNLSTDIFLLANPLVKDEITELQEYLDAYDNMVCTGTQNDIRIFIVLLAYDTERPAHINAQIAPDCFQRLMSYVSRQDDYQKEILYLDNQSLDNAAICREQEDHDIMLPRMLCDFMMLLSNINNRYGIGAAITSPTINTHIFSIGYSEYMYYYPDVTEYLKLADEYDLYTALLYGEKEDDSLDLNKSPWGMQSKREALENIYTLIPYDQKADDGNNADCKIAFLLQGLKQAVESYNTDNPNNTITWIERDTIYSRHHDGTYEQNAMQRDSDINAYNGLISRVCSNGFDVYLLNKRKSAPKMTTPQKPKNFFSRIFSRKKNKTAATQQTPARKYDELFQTLKEIRKLREEQDAYVRLVQTIDAYEKKRKDLKKRIDDFKLNSEIHSTSFSTMIDLEELKAYQERYKDKRINEIKQEYNGIKSPAKESLFDICKRLSENNDSRYRYIDWNDSWSFIKELSDDELCRYVDQLYVNSIPFINFKSTAAQAKNLITVHLYTDNETYKKTIDNNGNNIKCQLQTFVSTHTESKMCMFQFLPIDDDALEGLADKKQQDFKAMQIQKMIEEQKKQEEQDMTIRAEKLAKLSRSIEEKIRELTQKRS